MSSPIVVKYALTRELYADLHQAIGRKSTGMSDIGWGLLMWVMVTFPLSAILGKLFVSHWPMGAQLLLAAAISGALTLWMRLNVSRKVQATLAAEDEIEFRFSEAGIDQRTKLSETKLEWGVYARFWETDKYFFLCYNNRSVDAVPKSAFSGPDDFAAFKELLGRKVTSGAKDPHPILGRTRLIFYLALIIIAIMLWGRQLWPPAK